MKNQMICVITFTFSLSGCGLSWFADPLTNPVIEDQIGPIFGTEKLATLATTSSRRTITVRLTGVGGDDSVEGMFCAEPSPDMAENVANSISTAIEANLTQPQANVQGSGRLDFAKALATSIESLSKRSQGLQLYRDASYQLCQALLNGVIDGNKYNELSASVLKASIKLINYELKLNNGVISGSSMRTQLPQTSTTVNNNGQPVNATTNQQGGG